MRNKQTVFYSLLRWVYTGLFCFVLPLLFLRLWLRGRKNLGYRERWFERLGFFNPPVKTGGLWLHAVSVGESVAAIPFVRAFQKKYPHLPVTFTCSTLTGSARVQSTFGASVFHVYFPYDVPFFFNQFIKRVRPILLVLTETEIWPNCLEACQQHNIPITMINARLSPRSMKGYKRLGFLMREMLQKITQVAAQSELDGKRFIELGLEPSRLQVTGNIKFDVPTKLEIETAAKQFRTSFIGTRPVWIAGSTHQGEETQVLEAFSIIQKQFTNALLILVPRHPERFKEVGNLLEQQEFRYVTRSSQQPITSETQVFLGDTMGEMEFFYGVSDLAFVGGSLIAIGGHNTLEPAALGIPVIVGPHVHNFIDITKLLLESQGLVQIVDSQTLANAVIDWFANPSKRIKAGACAKEVVERNRGAVNKILELLEGCISSNSLHQV